MQFRHGHDRLSSKLNCAATNTLPCRIRYLPNAALVLRKGSHPAIDSYSAFYENDRKAPTGLAGHLRERELTRIFLAGLAFDVCVRYSAEDARREGFATVVVEDLNGSVAATCESLAALGVPCLKASQFP